MNYQKIYDAIISKRLDVTPIGYVEIHHIIPKSLGGSNNKSNLVALTAREHFICHLLLVKIHKDSINYFKMVKAFFMMRCESKNQNRFISSRYYEKMRIDYVEAQKQSQIGEKNSQHNSMWIHSLELKVSKKVDKNSPIPKGWSKVE